ncbi:MAG: hypothetical protein ACH346_02995 [Chthoniobacterales bacterium]
MARCKLAQYAQPKIFFQPVHVPSRYASPFKKTFLDQALTLIY